MNPPLKSDLKNLTKQDKTDTNRIVSSHEKNMQNVITDNKSVKQKKIIKNIQINPEKIKEKIKNLGISDQIIAAVRKLNADLSSSIDIDLTKVKSINNHKLPIQSEKSLEPLPSTSKVSIRTFKTIVTKNPNDNNVKGTLNKFLQCRQNSKLTNSSGKIKSQETGNTKAAAKRVYDNQKSNSKPLKSIKEDDNFNNSSEIQEEFLLNSILNDSTDEQINNDIDKNDLLEQQNLNAIHDNLPVNESIIQNNRQRKISESIRVANSLEPKVRILHEIKSEKKLTDSQNPNTTKSKDELLNLIKTSSSSEIILPNISPLKKLNTNDNNDNTKIPSFSDLTLHIIEKWRNDSKVNETTTGTDSYKTEKLCKLNNLKTESVEKSISPSAISRRHRIIPSSILNIKKNLDNPFKPNNTQSTQSSDVKTITSKVILNINGAQVTNYKPIMNRKRKISENLIENPIATNIKSKIIKIQDKFIENLNIKVNIQEENLNAELKTQQENSKSTTKQLQNENLNLQHDISDNEAMITENIPKVEEKLQQIEEKSLNKSEQDGVDFLVNLGDTIEQIDISSDSSSDVDESNVDSDNSDFFKKFPTLLNQTIKMEEINSDNDDFNENNIFDDVTNNDDDNDIESPNYESISVNNMQQNQLLINSINSQTTSPTERKPIVIENKILKGNEKIDLIYLNNIPHFETPTKGNHEIGQTILLKPCQVANFNKQTYNITDHSYNEPPSNENLIISDDFTENYNDIKNENITINPNEYVIEEICTSVNDDSVQNISDLCVVENVDNELIKNEINNTNNNETVQVKSTLNYIASLPNEVNPEINLISTHVNIKNENELKHNTIKESDEILINNEKNVETENTQTKLLENVIQNKPPMKSRRLRGGKINLISRNKSSIKKPNDNSNIKESSTISDPTEESTNLSDEVIVNAETSLANSVNMKSKNVIIGDKPLQEINNTTENVLNKLPKNICDNISNILDNNTTSNIGEQIEIQEKSKKINPFECISKKLIENDNTEIPPLNKNTENNKSSTLNVEKRDQFQKEQEKNKIILTEFNINEENSLETEISKLKSSNENIFKGLIGDNSTVESLFDEDISRNSSLNDSLEMEEPFHGFDDSEMKLYNYEVMKKTFEKLSNDDSILNNCTISNDTINKNPFNINKNARGETYKKVCDKLSIKNTDAEISPIKANISKSTSDQRRDSKTQLDNSTNLVKNTLKSNKTEKTYSKRQSKKSEFPSNKNSTIRETVTNLNNAEHVSTDSENETIILRKLSKRRILNSSDDDDDNIPVKKQSSEKTVKLVDNKKHNISKESSTNLSKTEKIKSNKFNNPTKHEKPISKTESSIKDDNVLSTKKSLKVQSKSKSKSRKNENDQKITKKSTTPEILIPIENDIKNNLLPKNYENISNVHKNDNKNSIDMTKLDETTKFENDISNSNLSTPILPKNRGKKPKNVTENIEVMVESDKDILNENENIKKPSKGRARKTVDRKIHPRLLLITNRVDIDKEDEKKNNTKKIQNNEIQCGMCKEVMLKTMWDKHKKVHYGIGWKMGEEAIDLSSHSAVLCSLINCFKSSKVKSLPCRMCNKCFGSGLGLLAHLEMCGLTEDEKRNQCYVKCEHCSGEFSRYSLANHLKTCKNLLTKINFENDENDEEITNNETNFVISNAGRLKRQSMIRAENKFKDLDKTDFDDVGDYIKSVTSVRGGQFKKWKKEIETYGSAKCSGTGCNLKFDTYEKIREHVKICKYLTKTGYRCTRCKYHNESIDAVRQHISKEHKFAKKDFDSGSDTDDNYKDVESGTSTEDESSGVDENDEEKSCVSDDENNDNNDKNKKPEKRIRENIIKASNRFKKLIDIERCYSDKLKFHNWTTFFFQYNYTKSILFPNITVDCKISNMKLDLFQPKNLLSMKFSFSNNPMNQSFNSSTPLTEWREMEQLKSATFENEQLIFVGGPVTCVKWLPTDNETTTPQYLAITYKRNYNTFIHCINPHKQKTLILIYKIDSITEFKNKENLGNFVYGITYNDGPINDIDFLPSGGYIPEINRLGLLSIASINNDIIIYSLPIKAPQNCDNINNSINIIDLKIAIQLKLKLLLDKNDKSDQIYNVSATKVVWSKAKGHKIVVASYTNGFIAIWNLTEEDNLNYMKINDIPTYLPINYFRASNKTLTGLDLHYHSNGTRWLITSTIDRSYKVIDIENPCNPIFITEDINKTFITSVVWPLIWENPCYSTSDELYQSSIQTLSPLTIYYKQRRYARHSSSINDISYNNWYNIMACGGDNGDFSIEFNGKMNLDVIQKQEKKLHSYTDLIQLNKEKIVDKSLTDKMTFFDIDFRNKYGLIFGPIKYVQKDLTFLQKKRNPPINMNCYVKINRVDCNNNENAKQLFAIGYENGFVRILNINNNNLKNN